MQVVFLRFNLRNYASESECRKSKCPFVSYFISILLHFDPTSSRLNGMESPAAKELEVALSALQLETTNNKAVLTYAAVLSVPLAPPSLPLIAQRSFSSRERRTAVIFQSACENHQFIRNNDISTIVERPERIRAVKMGTAAAWAGMEAKGIQERGMSRFELGKIEKVEEELVGLMGGLGIADQARDKGKGREVRGGPFDVLFSNAVMNIDDPSLHFIHGDPNIAPAPSPIVSIPIASTSTPSKRSPTKDPIPLPPPLSYAHQLQAWCRASTTAIMTAPAFSEVPAHLSQGDLYLSPGSEEAILGALGATCEAVDRVCTRSIGEGGYDRIFVAIRPPGHHCAEVDPSGFCWVNNVAVAAAHGLSPLSYRPYYLLTFGVRSSSRTWYFESDHFRYRPTSRRWNSADRLGDQRCCQCSSTERKASKSTKIAQETDSNETGFTNSLHLITRYSILSYALVSILRALC